MYVQVLPGLSEPERARAILEELATDPGVLHVLEKHRWNVGALCELYPEVRVMRPCSTGAMGQTRADAVEEKLHAP